LHNSFSAELFVISSPVMDLGDQFSFLQFHMFPVKMAIFLTFPVHLLCLPRPDSVSSRPSSDISDHFTTSSFHSLWHWRWRQCIPPKYWYPPSGWHCRYRKYHSLKSQLTWQKFYFTFCRIFNWNKISFICTSFIFFPKIFSLLLKLIIFKFIKITCIL
jgi:hypothetical protein